MSALPAGSTPRGTSPAPTSSVPSAATDGAWNSPSSGRPKGSTSQLHGRHSGGAEGWIRQTPMWTSVGSQQAFQPVGQIHQLVECESGVPKGQILTDVLAQTAQVVSDQSGPCRSIPRRQPGSGILMQTLVRSSSPASGGRGVHPPLYPQTDGQRQPRSGG